MAVRVEYLGFTSQETSRQYRLRVTDGGGAGRDFILSISHEAFSSRRARFQDAPEICFQKLQRHLEASPETPPETQVAVTDADLEQYRLSHTPKPRTRGTPAAATEPAPAAASPWMPKEDLKA